MSADREMLTTKNTKEHKGKRPAALGSALESKPHSRGRLCHTSMDGPRVAADER